MYLAKHNVMALQHSPHFLEESSSSSILFPGLECVKKKRTMIRKCQGKSLQKWWEHWQRNHKMDSRNASKSFRNVCKSVSLPKGTTLKEILCKQM
jgi:hypothetical protein